MTSPVDFISGPSTTFAPVPMSMEPSARLGWPAVRMKLFMPNAMNCSGQPATIIVMKSSASGRTESSAPE